jgi:hypothetical protein
MKTQENMFTTLMEFQKDFFADYTKNDVKYFLEYATPAQKEKLEKYLDSYNQKTGDFTGKSTMVTKMINDKSIGFQD